MPLRSAHALLVTSLLLVSGTAASAQTPTADFDPQTFKAPPAQYRGHAMGSINMTRDTPQSLAAEVDEAKKLNYGGLFFEPGGTTSLGLSPDYLKRFARGTPGTKGVEFLSPEYFALYDTGMQQAKKDGLEVVLYDDYSFPSGTAGGLLFSKFPQFAAKSLNTYIHKVKDGRDIYFFANSSPRDIDTKVVLRGHKTLTIWNPHTGAEEPADATTADTNGQPTTTVHLKLASVTSLFYVGE